MAKKKSRAEQILERMDEIMYDLNDAQLEVLYKRVLARLKQRDRIREMQAATNWRVGDRVKFLDKKKMRITGSVIRVNKRSLTILSDGHPMKWRVHYGAVKPLEEEAK